ncbi:MAG TPA: hypothetical protein VN903_14520 [Polyangia bacterium]|nr:hypothetical protein [Polyangia bacterium]
MTADAGVADDVEAAAHAKCHILENVLKSNAGRPGREAIADHDRQMLASCLANARKQIENERRQRQAEEDARVEAEKRDAAEDRERERKANDPVFQREALSESLCDATWRKKCALAAIAAEKKLSKRAGVVNLRLLQDQKEILRDAENDIREAQQELKAKKLKPLACKPAECEQ